ncbi:MAG: hypothetical protein EON54_00960 [Alcaligenaceae bacterium]|nr:MAG: hypothetical protein EON54_00960 [Alcaligenaceae bacterium]
MKPRAKKAAVGTAAATWCGDDPETGWAKIRWAGQAFYGVGRLHEDDGAKGADVMQLKTSANGLSVRCASTGRTLRFIGALLPSNRAAAWDVLKQLEQTNTECVVPPVGEDVASSQSLSVADRRELAWFNKQMARVRVMRSAGTDPSVSLRFIVIYLGESRASLQRKIGAELAKPMKRGGRNFWPLSQVDEYSQGRLAQ